MLRDQVPSGCSYDNETGEVLTFIINEETGEPMMMGVRPVHPNVEARRVLNARPDATPPQQPAPVRKYMKFPHGYMSKTKKFQSLKANILAGSNPTSHRMLLIPTLMVFPRIFCVMLMVLEIYLHARCHKKNRRLKNPNLYYQSPFHILTSKFCSVCRDCETASKITQMQDKRRDRYDYLNRIPI